MSNIDAENDEEKQAFLPTSSQREGQVVVNQRRHNAWSCLRLALEVLMACSIALLVLQPVVHGRGSSPVPSFPRKIYKFLENSTYLNGAMFASEKDTLHTLHNWIPLSSDARGYVSVPDYAAYDLGKPLSVRLNRTDEGPGYMMSVFHQLHCLSYIVQHFQTGFGGANLTDEVAHHSAHCFDYLRQSIMCSADTTLEGKTDAGPGWGSDHLCVDYDALLAWANEHSAMKWRNLMPEESVL